MIYIYMYRHMYISIYALHCITSFPPGSSHGVMILWTVAALACLMGLHLVASVGGGDMLPGRNYRLDSS